MSGCLKTSPPRSPFTSLLETLLGCYDAHPEGMIHRTVSTPRTHAFLSVKSLLSIERPPRGGSEALQHEMHVAIYI